MGLAWVTMNEINWILHGWKSMEYNGSYMDGNQWNTMDLTSMEINEIYWILHEWELMGYNGPYIGVLWLVVRTFTSAPALINATATEVFLRQHDAKVKWSTTTAYSEIQFLSSFQNIQIHPKTTTRAKQTVIESNTRQTTRIEQETWNKRNATHGCNIEYCSDISIGCFSLCYVYV